MSDTAPAPDASQQPEFVTVAKVGDIAPNTGEAYEVGEKMVAVFYTDGQYYAIDDFCPHMGSSLAPGQPMDGAVACPWHAWRFRLSDGCWLNNPKLKIPSYEVRVVGDSIQVASKPRD